MDDFQAPRWLPGGHLQTIWPALFSRRFDGIAPAFRRERWVTPDHDFIDVDWLGPGGTPQETGATGPRGIAAAGDTRAASASGATDAAPLLVLFHGLEGSSRSHYAQAFAAEAARRGWRFAVPHFRGCSGEINLAPRAYHSGDHAEIAWMLGRLRAAHAGPLLAVGVSLGGNALLRYAEEAGAAASSTLRALAAISAPLDLAAGADAISRGVGRQIYTRMFMRSMTRKALVKLAQHPGLFDVARLRAARDLRQFDDVVTAPLHGFRDAADYYARASAKPRLATIRIPALVVNALNDPFLPASALPRPDEVGAQVTLWQPRHGGHVGFPAGAWPGHVTTLPQAVAAWLAERL